MRTLLLGMLLFGLSALTGCGGPVGSRFAVSGQVTLQGVPLDQGTITFFSGDSTGPSRAVGGAMIVNGAYELPAAQGLDPGMYRVVLSAPEPSTSTPEDYAAGKMPLAGKERIPPEFGEASTQTVTVDADGANRFDFAIP